MAAHDVGIGTEDFDGFLGRILPTAGKKEHEGRTFVKVVFHHGLGFIGRHVGGVAEAGAATGQPFFHGSVGADVTRGRIAAHACVAAHDAFAQRVDDGRAVAHRDGIHRAAKILGARGNPALLKAGEFRTLAQAHGIAGTHAVGAHPDLRAAVGRIGSVGLVQRASAAGAHHCGSGAEHIKLAIAHANARGPGAAAIVYQKARSGHAVVHIRAGFQGFFGHNGLELLAVDGNIPFATVADVALFVPQNGQAPAFQIINTFVEFAGVGKGKVFAQGAAAHL